MVHAGVRPGVALDQQAGRDLRWIRDDFLVPKTRLDAFIVHGHTPEVEITVHPHRLGVDSGGFRSGILTAARIDHNEIDILQFKISPK